jgi:hypothetical protein
MPEFEFQPPPRRRRVPRTRWGVLATMLLATAGALVAFLPAPRWCPASVWTGTTSTGLFYAAFLLLVALLYARFVTKAPTRP